jgi:hypothetical protein
MNIDLAGEPVPDGYRPALEQRFLRLRNSSGARIVCVSGTVLITACKEFRDIELCANEAFVVPNKGLVLVEAIGAATVILERPSRAGFSWRTILLSIGLIAHRVQ